MTTAEYPRDGLGGHPSEEAVAAFIEGNLPQAERRRMVEHMADCEPCRELLRETVELRRDLLPAEDRRDEATEEAVDEDDEAPRSNLVDLPLDRGTTRRTLPKAALWLAAAVLLLLGWTAWKLWFPASPGPSTSVADLTAPLGERHPNLAVETDEPGWPRTLGGGPGLSREDEAEFRRGVETCKLDLALRQGDSEAVVQLTHSLEASYSAEGLVGIPAYFASIRDGLDADRPRTELAGLLATADELGSGSDLYLLGAWSCSARLAARVGDVAWFAEPAPVDAITHLREAELPAVLHPLVLATSQRISPPGDLEPTDLPELESRLHKLIQVGGGERVD